MASCSDTSTSGSPATSVAATVRPTSTTVGTDAGPTSTTLAATTTAPPPPTSTAAPPRTTRRLEQVPSVPANVLFDFALVENLGPVVSIGGDCAVTEAGSVACWDVGFGDRDRSELVAYTVVGIDDAMVVRNSSRGCAIRRSGRLVCWPLAGQRGDTATKTFTPLRLDEIAVDSVADVA